MNRWKTTVFVHLHVCNFATSEDKLFFVVLKTVVFSASLLRESLAHSKPIRYEAYLRSDWFFYIFLYYRVLLTKESVTIGCVIVGQFSGAGPTVLLQLPIQYTEK